MKFYNKKILSLIFSMTLLMVACFISINNGNNLQVAKADTNYIQLTDNKVYYIRNQKSNLYMDIENADYANNTRVMQYYFTGKANQQFRLQARPHGRYEIVPVISPDKRIDIYCSQQTNGAPVNIYTDNPDDIPQTFKIINDGNGTGSFKILKWRLKHE